MRPFAIGVASLALLLGTAPVTGEGLPMAPARSLETILAEGTWLSVDVATDSGDLLIDLLGDIYRIPATGGVAQAIQAGMDFSAQPAWSPNGRRVVFVSDRNGHENLWLMDADGGDLIRLSDLDDNSELVSPAFAADGGSVYVSQLRPDRTVLELWQYPVGQGQPVRVLPADDPMDQARPNRVSYVDVAPSADGRYLYYSARANFFYEGPDLAPWQLRRFCLESGREETLVDAPGGGLRPTLDRDGRRLVYATRLGGQTQLRVMDLTTRRDRHLLNGGLPADQQSRWASQGLLPRMSFSADGQAVVVARNGRLQRIELDGGEATELPFEAEVSLALGPAQVEHVGLEDGPVQARLVRHPVLSPDGQYVAFTALAGLYLKNLADGGLRRLSSPDLAASHPAWSADGRHLLYTTWSANEAGHVWQIGVNEAPDQARRVTSRAAWYRNPVYAADGESVLVLRGRHDQRLVQRMEYGAFQGGDLLRVPLDGGPVEELWHGAIEGPVQFVNRDSRLYLHTDQGLVSLDAGGGDLRQHLHVTGRSYYFQAGRSPVHALRLSPDGSQALVVSWSQAWLLGLPALDAIPPDNPVALDLDDPKINARRLSRRGADHVFWSADGLWAGRVLGAELRLTSLEDDSVAEEVVHKLTVSEPRDRPQGRLLLTGATLVTMRGDEVIENGELLVEDNRIAALGQAGELDREGAEVTDLSGHYIVPGLIDAHAHWAGIRRDQLDLESPGLMADLAWGVTAGLDVSTLTIDMLEYQDLVDTGRVLGPRLFSTATAVFSFNPLNDLDDARDILRRYREGYRVGNIKQYRVGPRRARQWLAMAAVELGLRVTTEGADNQRLSLTQIIDGYAGLEHALPVAGLHQDVIELMAASGFSYTPTLSTLGGASGRARYLDQATPERLGRFLPPATLDELTRFQPRLRDDLYYADDHAADVLTLWQAGVNIAAGSHGEVPGLGMHFELQALVQGGLTPHQAWQIATVGSARAIGRHQQLGSLEPGKLADLVILTENPLARIEHSLSIRHVMHNGRLRDARDLAELWPRKVPGPRLWFHERR